MYMYIDIERERCSVKDHPNLLHSSPRSNKTCVRQVVRSGSEWSGAY